MSLLALDRLSLTLHDTPILGEVSLGLAPGEILGLVGESGSGKSMTALAILGLLPPQARTTGSIRLDGREISTLPEAALCRMRGAEAGIVFQEPMSALNPLMSIGDQVAETLRVHQRLPRAEALAIARDRLDRVGLPAHRFPLSLFPHELSGGQRQRVAIALAIALRPRLLIADEPTTAIDVTTQAQILNLLRRQQEKRNMAIIFITHDLGVIAQMASYVVVMYLGRVMERGTVNDIFHAPKHPYTQALLRSIPNVRSKPRVQLPIISGSIPHPFNRPEGCPFHPRCESYMAGKCEIQIPPLVLVGENQYASCLRYSGAAEAAFGSANGHRVGKGKS
jgi:oligopeptide/dipeptide ABC transporter ATP-binding protein